MLIYSGHTETPAERGIYMSESNSSAVLQPTAYSEITIFDPKRWIIIGLLSIGVIIAFVSRTNISAALAYKPFIQMFHLSDIDRGALSSAFFWSYAALQIPTGWIVDRYGVKKPY